MNSRKKKKKQKDGIICECGRKLKIRDCICKYVYFEGMKIPEGIGAWSMGGATINRAWFILPVTPEFEPTREIIQRREKNGRHALHVVYPGCFIVKSICLEPPVIINDYYQVVEIDRNKEKIYCKRVFDFDESLDDRVQRCTRYIEQLAFEKDCVRNHFYWRHDG